MVSNKLTDMMNKAISMEVQASIQYMWQHVKHAIVASGICGDKSVADALMDFSIQKMFHAEKIAQRVDYLGGDSTIEPLPITVGTTSKEMIDIDMKAEEDTIAFYKQLVAKAIEEQDYVTRKLFEKIISDEEDHLSILRTLLELI